MRLLLDTCAVLWIAAAPDKLSSTARNAIAANPSELFVSAISAFEVSLKHRRKKLDLGMEPDAWWTRAVAHHGIVVLPVTDQIALASTAFPLLHADPCDRIILATAVTHGAGIVTCDKLIAQYGLAPIIW